MLPLKSDTVIGFFFKTHYFPPTPHPLIDFECRKPIMKLLALREKSCSTDGLDLDMTCETTFHLLMY